MGVKVVEGHERYFGVPTLVEKSKTYIFTFVEIEFGKISKVGRKLFIQNKLWGVNQISGAINPILCYGMLPPFLSHLWWDSKAYNPFLLGGRDIDGKKIHWMGWKIISRNKREGNLGFHFMYDINLPLLAKQLRRILTNEESLMAMMMKAKYFPNLSI